MSPKPGAAPRTGALGLACRLFFSWPALDGNVGNMDVGFGRGSSLKYLWLSISLAEGRREGSSESRLSSKDAPALVKVGNFDRMTLPNAPFWLLGSRRERALGRRLKPGQVSSVGIPHSSKICMFVNYKTWIAYRFSPALRCWMRDSPCSVGRLHSSPVVAGSS